MFNKIIKSVPNTITLLNLLSGMAAISYAFKGNLEMAMILIFASAIFDFFDGFAARLLKAYSNIGKDLDSLADMVSFGVAPASMLYMASDGNYAVFLLVAFSALRLAKFNNDTRQTTSFIGLPTPANAFFFSSGAYLSLNEGCVGEIYNMAFASVTGSTILTIIFSLLMVSEIPMFSLKFKSYAFKDNMMVYTFLIASAIALATLNVAALPLIILVYVIISIISMSLFNNSLHTK